MLYILLFTLIKGSWGGVVSFNISGEVENGTVFQDPEHLIPRGLDIIVTPTNQTIEFLDPSELTPKAALENRATTGCGCGYSSTNPASGRIVGGQVVNPTNKLPYQVYVQTCFSSGCAMCGGTLLNKRYVMTAMHCVKSGTTLASNINVALGAYSISPMSSNAQSIKVERIITRDDYDEKSTNNDIALLRLSVDANLNNNNIIPACLPTNKAVTYENMDAITSGWGTTSEGGKTSDILKETTVKITPQSDPTCAKYATSGTLPNTKMCAYQTGTDSCQGDSGGPLVLKEDGRFTVVGVVSYGNGCAKSGYAGVYARVTTYLDWINANIQDGWCTAAPITSSPAVTTTPPPPSPGANVCDLTCTTVGQYTGNGQLNGISSSCTSGKCYAINGSDLCAVFAYPCGKPTTTTTTTTTTRTTLPPPSPAKVCDLTCTTVGQYTGNAQLNGLTSVCSAGKCYATNGSDLCALFNYPCGNPSGPSLTCSNRCNMKLALASWMTDYQNGLRERISLAKLGFDGIPAYCDLTNGDCCPADNPGSDLCSRLGWFSMFG